MNNDAWFEAETRSTPLVVNSKPPSAPKDRFLSAVSEKYKPEKSYSLRDYRTINPKRSCSLQQIKHGECGLVSDTTASFPSPRLAASGVNHDHRLGSSSICMTDGLTRSVEDDAATVPDAPHRKPSIARRNRFESSLNPKDGGMFADAASAKGAPRMGATKAGHSQKFGFSSIPTTDGLAPMERASRRFHAIRPRARLGSNVTHGQAMGFSNLELDHEIILPKDVAGFDRNSLPQEILNPAKPVSASDNEEDAYCFTRNTHQTPDYI